MGQPRPLVEVRHQPDNRIDLSSLTDDAPDQEPLVKLLMLDVVRRMSSLGARYKVRFHWLYLRYDSEGLIHSLDFGLLASP